MSEQDICRMANTLLAYFKDGNEQVAKDCAIEIVLWHESEVEKLKAENERMVEALKGIMKTDRTPTYMYYGRNTKNRLGKLSPPGTVWSTPYEIAAYALFGYGMQYEDPKEAKDGGK